VPAFARRRHGDLLAIVMFHVVEDEPLSPAVFLATGPMGSGETPWSERLWLAIASAVATEIDLAELGLGARRYRQPRQGLRGRRSAARMH